MNSCCAERKFSTGCKIAIDRKTTERNGERIIMKDGKLLMVGNGKDYLYSVGGRLKFGETAEEAVIREVFEETGVQMGIDRLGFVHENYFYGDMPSNRNKLIYEISFFFYMKVPDTFAPVSESFAEGSSKERLLWVSLDEDVKIYPEFFKTELKNPTDAVKHFTSDVSLRRGAVVSPDH